MRRRDFIKGIAGSATAWPLVARATDRLYRIGVLMGYTEGDLEAQSYIVAFREGLRTLGWTEGRDILIDNRWATPGDAESMNVSRKNSSRYGLTLFFRKLRPRRPRCCNKHEPSLSFSRSFPIRSAAGSLLAIGDLVATSLVSTFPSRRRAASGLNCSKRLHRASLGWRCCTTPKSATYAGFWLNPFRAAGAALAVETISAPVRRRSRNSISHCRTGTRAQ